MKKKQFFLLSHLIIVISMLGVMLSCAKENSLRVFQNTTEIDFFYFWSSATKADTLVFDCAETLKTEEEVYNPKASIKLYLRHKVLNITEEDNPTPSFDTDKISSSSKGASPTTHTINKEFLFDDGNVAYADAIYESYSDINGSKLSHISISSIDFIKSNAQKSSSTSNAYDVTLDFKITYVDEKTKKEDTLDATLQYQKIISNTSKDEPKEEDTLKNTSYSKAISWTDENNFFVYVEKTENWSLSGEKKTTFSSPSLFINLTAKEDKTLNVENFDFTVSTNSKETTEDISKDNWKIEKTTVTKTITCTNAKDSFEDTFIYPVYKISYSLDDKIFDFDLSVAFDIKSELTQSSTTKATITNLGTLSFSSHNFNAEVKTTLELKENTPPIADNTPKYGKILAHYVTAIYSPTGSVTKKAIVIRYEEGYHWGICEYEEDFPSSFTYTQHGYSGFNSVGYHKQDAKYYLAKAKDENAGIYWMRENNSIVSAIDYVSCKSKGWKNSFNGKYSYKMNPYKEEYSNSNYTLTISAPSGQKRTFNSKQAD